MTYKQALHGAMLELAKDPLTRFVGYGIKPSVGVGSFSGIANKQLIETPVAENLMVGLATGLSLAGLRPVVYLERFDFALCAADAIVNHLDKLALMSRGEFQPGVILRIVVGNKRKPLFTGETHTQNFAEAFRSMLAMPVMELKRAEEIAPAYAMAYGGMKRGLSTMIIEEKDLI